MKIAIEDGIESRVAEIVKILKLIDNKVPVDKVCEDYPDITRNITPKLLATAQQHVVEDEGLKTEDYFDNLVTQAELVKSAGSELKKSLSASHYLRQEMYRHEFVLIFMDELSDTQLDIDEYQVMDNNSELNLQLDHAMLHFRAAERHNEAEEKVLFNNLRKCGYYLYSNVFDIKRGVLSDLLIKLGELVKSKETREYENFKKNLKEITGKYFPLQAKLIFLQENIIYPLSYQIVNEMEFWLYLKKQGNQIGYCCFDVSRS